MTIILHCSVEISAVNVNTYGNNIKFGKYYYVYWFVMPTACILSFKFVLLKVMMLIRIFGMHSIGVDYFYRSIFRNNS